jgi:tetratricopeptide (TPR) repeat protein
VCECGVTFARLAADRLKCKNADEMRRWGFTSQQWNAASFLQRVFRGRNARLYFNRMRRAIVIMEECETLYLNNPSHVPYKVRSVGCCMRVVPQVIGLACVCACLKMNYTLYLHAIKHDYTRARPLYLSLVEYMNQRGPDNAIVLYSFALFLAATLEEDFGVIEVLLERARAADSRRVKFDLAEHGFFRQALIINPKDAHSMFNWALVLQFMHDSYDEAEQFYMRALDAAPHDRRIVENYNYMLQNYKMADYDAYEAFRRLQEERAMVAVQEQSDKTIFEMRTDAAIAIQKSWRGFRVRDMLWVGRRLRCCVLVPCSRVHVVTPRAVVDAIRAHLVEAIGNPHGR